MMTFQQFVEAQLPSVISGWAKQTREDYSSLGELGDAIMENPSPKALANFLGRVLKITNSFNNTIPSIRGSRDTDWKSVNDQTIYFDRIVFWLKLAIKRLMADSSGRRDQRRHGNYVSASLRGLTETQVALNNVIGWQELTIKEINKLLADKHISGYHEYLNGYLRYLNFQVPILRNIIQSVSMGK